MTKVDQENAATKKRLEVIDGWRRYRARDLVRDPRPREVAAFSPSESLPHPDVTAYMIVELAIERVHPWHGDPRYDLLRNLVATGDLGLRGAFGPFVPIGVIIYLLGCEPSVWAGRTLKRLDEAIDVAIDEIEDSIERLRFS